MHECENCGEVCYCDCDDLPCPAPSDCSCPCWDGDDDNPEDRLEDAPSTGNDGEFVPVEEADHANR